MDVLFIARRLGVDIGALAPADRNVDGVVDMIIDATANSHLPLSEERLLGWHASLFPTGYSGLSKITVCHWRDDATGPTQVVSGPIGRQRVHFEAPPARRLNGELSHFLEWINKPSDTAPLIKAGLSHLWFVTLHPFDDGNGRIARAIDDLLLARADTSSQRFYSLSAQIQRERSAYYTTLEHTQKQKGPDVTSPGSFGLTNSLSLGASELFSFGLNELLVSAGLLDELLQPISAPNKNAAVIVFETQRRCHFQ